MWVIIIIIIIIIALTLCRPSLPGLSLHIRPSSFAVSGSLCNHSFTHLLSLCSFLCLPVSGLSMSGLLLVFCHCCQNVRTFCQKSIFMTWKIPGHRAFRTEFCGTQGQRYLKIHKTPTVGNVPGKPGWMRSLFQSWSNNRCAVGNWFWLHFILRNKFYVFCVSCTLHCNIIV